MTELLVGTKKGLFVLDGDVGAGFEVTARAFPGAVGRVRDARSSVGALPRLRHVVVLRRARSGSTDDPAGEWQEAEGIGAARGRRCVTRADLGHRRRRGGRAALRRRRPGRACSRATTAGCTWALNRGLWDHPTRPDWSPGGGGLCLHTIVPWPGEPDRLMVAISAVGVWLSDDRGVDVAPLEQRHRARVPARGGARQPDPALRAQRPAVRRTTGAAVHAVPRRRLPLRRRRRQLDRRRRRDRPALRLRLPDRRRPGRSRQCLRDPAHRRGGQDDAGWRRPGLGDARRGRELGGRGATAFPIATRT